MTQGLCTGPDVPQMVDSSAVKLNVNAAAQIVTTDEITFSHLRVDERLLWLVAYQGDVGALVRSVTVWQGDLRLPGLETL